jgi:hypothetical protein
MRPFDVAYFEDALCTGNFGFVPAAPTEYRCSVVFDDSHRGGMRWQTGYFTPAEKGG